MIIQPHNFKILLSLLWLSHPTVSKFYQLSSWNFFGLLFPVKYLCFGRKVKTMYQLSILLLVILLMSRNVIFFEYFMPMSHVVNKTLPSISSTPPFPYHLFTRFLCCCTIKTLSSLFCSDQIIAKENAFSKENEFIFQLTADRFPFRYFVYRWFFYRIF